MTMKLHETKKDIVIVVGDAEFQPHLQVGFHRPRQQPSSNVTDSPSGTPHWLHRVPESDGMR